jgi:hypothetical protein
MSLTVPMMVFLLAGTNDAASEVAAIYGEPDIYSFSYEQYIRQGLNNFETKMLMAVYQDSLESALDSLYLELREKYSPAPDLLEYLDASHSAFLDYSRLWAGLCEEACWWDLEEGVREDGTARSYTYSFVLALYRWQKIVSYINLLRTGSPWVEGIPDRGRLGLDQLGGYYP